MVTLESKGTGVAVCYQTSDFRMKTSRGIKGGHSMMINSDHQERMAILEVYTADYRVSKYKKGTLIEMHGGSTQIHNQSGVMTPKA